MQPTENKQPAQEELIAHIRKSIKTHEEPYSLGAWENFNAKQQIKRTPIFWITRIGSVAAVLAICFMLFLYTKTTPEKMESELVKVGKGQADQQMMDDSGETLIDQIANGNSNIIAQNEGVVVIKSTLPSAYFEKNLAANILDANSVKVPVAGEVLRLEQSNNLETAKSIIDENTEQIIAAVTESKFNTNDFLIQETKEIEKTSKVVFKNKGKDKWVLGLMIAPSFGNAEELNMGYGVTMGYNFSDKLSLNTGVSYNEMSASKDFKSNIGMSSILFGNNKSLAAVSQKITGLDIPLELKYSFNKNIYASLGLSAFAVIGQSRSNTFIQGVVVKASMNDKTSSSSGSASGTSSSAEVSDSKGQFANSYILNKKTVEKAILEDQNNVNYLGFYNFSFGYKKKLLKNHFIAFEPFVKLPIREVTQDNLRLVGAGLRLKVDF